MPCPAHLTRVCCRAGRYSLEMYFWDSDVELFTLTLRGEVSETPQCS